VEAGHGKPQESTVIFITTYILKNYVNSSLRMVYDNLAAALPEEEQTVYKQRVEELSPSLRYCAYNVGDESAINDLLKMRGTGQGDLMANLEVFYKNIFGMKFLIIAKEILV
jgi:hypothetical protein